MQLQYRKLHPVKAFVSKQMDIYGGVTLASGDLTQEVVFDGTPIGRDENNLYHVIKTAQITQVNTGNSTYTVKKGHNFKVGDFVAIQLGGLASQITGINAEGETEDVFTVGAVLEESASTGSVLFEAKEASTSTTSAFRYEPVGLTGTPIYIEDDTNHFCDCVTGGKVKEAQCPPLNPAIKSALSDISFV